MEALIVTPNRDHPDAVALAQLLRARPWTAPPQVLTPDAAADRCRAGDAPAVFAVMTDGTPDVVRRLLAGGAGLVFAVGPATDPKAILRTLQAGAEAYLDAAELETDLDAALVKLRAAAPAEDRPKQIIAVLAAAGGCGASTVAVNFAALLATARGRCNLLDLNPGKADLAPLLDLKPQYTLADLCRNEDRLDRSLYEKLLTPHRTGIALLAAPREYESVRAVTARGVIRALELAVADYDDVVVDLDDCFHTEQVAVLERASRVLLVCRLDFTAVRNTRRILDHLLELGVERGRVDIVVNHCGLPGELPVEEAETAVGGKLIHFLPHDPATLFAANNMGIPAALTAPHSDFVTAVTKLAGLAPAAAAAAPVFARFAGTVRTALAPRFRSVRDRLTGGRTAPAPATEAEETKVHYEPARTETVRRPGPARPVAV